MRVLVKNTARGVRVSVVEPEDLRRLNVDTDLAENADISAALDDAGAGAADDEHAWLNVSYLRSAAPATDEYWQTGFVAMIDYAAKSGWLSTDGSRVRAHIEREEKAQ